MTSTPTTASPTPQKRKSLWRSWRVRFLLLLMALVVFVSICAILATRTPAWYRPLDAHDSKVAEASAHYQKFGWINQRTQLERVAHGNNETIEFKEEVLNAFLAVAFLPYEESQNVISGPVVVFSPGQVTVAGRVKNLPGIGSGVLSLTFHFEVAPPADPVVNPATQFRIRLDSASLGALRLPRWLVRDRLTKAMTDLAPTLDAAIQGARRNHDASSQADDLRDMFQRLAREESVPLPYEYHSGEGGRVNIRPVFLQAITIEDGRLKITLSASPLR